MLFTAGGYEMTIYKINPCPKPRQTRSDKWNKRECVMRYRAFADQCRLLGVKVPEESGHIIFHMPIPKSWSKKKKADMDMKHHKQKPDIDNLAKALMDAVYDDDSCVSDLRITKKWAMEGSIEIKV